MSRRPGVEPAGPAAARLRADPLPAPYTGPPIPVQPHPGGPLWRAYLAGYAAGVAAGIELGRGDANEEWTGLTSAACRAALGGPSHRELERRRSWGGSRR